MSHDQDRALDLLVALQDRASVSLAELEQLCGGDRDLALRVQGDLQTLDKMRWLETEVTTGGLAPTADLSMPAPIKEVSTSGDFPGDSRHFWQQVRRSGLLSEAELSAIEAELAPETARDATQLARTLIEHHQLTRYQARYVAQGKSHRLFCGPYIILDKLGAGGIGQVFRARHRESGEQVALKLLQREVAAASEALERFQREWAATRRLRHPHIVAALDAGEQSGQPFLALELITGENLAQCVQRVGPLPINQAVDYLLQAARGLEHAHSHGVIHRDVKPSNLLLDHQGVVRVCDLGMARLKRAAGFSSASPLTKTGAILGTVDYMAPEQADDTHAADVRSDVYGLGCTLFFLLTARPPYAGETLLERLTAHREAPLPDLGLIRPEASRQLVALLDRSLAKRPGDRYSSMAAWAEAAAAAANCGHPS